MFKKKNKRKLFLENYVKYHVPSLNWRNVVDGIESQFISYYTKNNKREKLNIRIRICPKHTFIHKIHVNIDYHDVHTFTAWGLSYLSLCILRERLELFVKKKRYETTKTNELLKAFMESEGYKNENKSKVQKVSKNPNP